MKSDFRIVGALSAQRGEDIHAVSECLAVGIPMRVGLVEAVLLGDAVCDEEYGGLEAVGDIAGFAGGFGRGDRVGHGPPLYWNWHTQQL